MTKQERIAELCKSENFAVSVVYIGPGSRGYSTSAIVGIGAEDTGRLRVKLDLLEKIAARMAANMLKGTIKYENDEYTLREWLEMGIDDGLDTVNYLALGLEKLDQLEERMGGAVENSDLFAAAKRADGSGA